MSSCQIEDDCLWDDDLDTVGQIARSSQSQVDRSYNNDSSRQYSNQEDRYINTFRSGNNRNSDSYSGTNRNSESYNRNYNRGAQYSGASDCQNWREARDGMSNLSIHEDTRSQGSFERRTTNNRYGREAADDKTEFMIDSSDVGKVIGRQGSKIKEFQEEHNVRINIDSKNSGYDEQTKVTLYGDAASRAAAKESIEEYLTSKKPYAPERKFEQNTSNGMAESNAADEPFDWDALRRRAEEEREKKFASLPPLKKNFYLEDPKIKNWRPSSVEEFRASKNNIIVQRYDGNDDRPILNPVPTFQLAFQKYPEILRELVKQGFDTPSPIQCQAWPILLSGHDMIGIAQTGSGKTIAYLLPALIHIENQIIPREERTGPTCLILAPTRELALQIEEEVKKYSYKGIKSLCIYGGGSRRQQINDVTKGVEIVIATPGRLIDLLVNNIIELSGVSYLVIDEADRMLDMGFEPQLKSCIRPIRPDRQTVMTSATWPEGVRRLVDQYLTKPFLVNVGSLDLTACHEVEQHIIFEDDPEARREIIFDFVRSMKPTDKAIIFVERKAMVDDIASDIILSGVECQSLHGDREQCDREQALSDLKTGIAKVLIATDLASRGLDVKDITHVFNLSMPKNMEDYVHRIGRTGRAGRRGVAITVLSRADWSKAPELVRILREADQVVPTELENMAQRYLTWKETKRETTDRRPRFRQRY